MLAPGLMTIDDDNFMTVLGGALAAQTIDLAPLLATPHSYRVRPPNKPPDWEPPGTVLPLKLYQPAHGHYNLVATSLVCQIPGLPEHQVHPELKEQVAFVLRRVAVPAPTDGSETAEWAWTNVPGGPKAWTAVTPGSEGGVLANEELMPLFPVRYVLDGYSRTLFVGLVPTSSVETFTTASSTGSPGAATATATAELMAMAFHTRVTSGLGQLIEYALEPSSRIQGAPALLLEFASFLNDWFPTSWAAVLAGGSPAAAAATLFGFLSSTDAGTTVMTDTAGNPAFDASGNPSYTGRITWLAALEQAWNQAEWLTGETSTVPPALLAVDLDYPTQSASTICTTLENDVGASQPEGVASTSGGVPGSTLATAPKYDPSDPYDYSIRCVYRRPQCVLVGDIVSARTEAFQIAAFYDFDAPARPVTISLPQVHSLADLRKFPRNLNLLLSKELHSQMDRIIDLKSTMNGTLNPPSTGDGLSVKWICSFSISIVFIVALFLLLMFVIMLNLFFFWLPFFEICLPVPE